MVPRTDLGALSQSLVIYTYMKTLEGIYKKEKLHIASEWMKYFMANQANCNGRCLKFLRPNITPCSSYPQYYPMLLLPPNITPIQTINNPPHPATCHHLGLTIALD